jgi:hypothetical protein
MKGSRVPHTLSHPRWRIRASVGSLALLAALAGCTSDDSPPDTTPPSTPSTSTGDPTTSPTPTPSVAPATGPRLDTTDASVRAPEGWLKKHGALSFSIFAADPKSGSSVGIEDLHTGETTTTLDQMAQTVIDGTSYGHKPKRLPNTTLDGIEVYHLAGRIDDLQYLVEYGAIYHNSAVYFSFVLTKTIPNDERQEIVDSVLATFRWK